MSYDASTTPHNNPLCTWLRTHGFWVYSSFSSPDKKKRKASQIVPPQKVLTHVFLDGGRASVPSEFTRSFWREYATALIKNPSVLQHAVELVPSGADAVFKMFLDLDLDFAKVVDQEAETQERETGEEETHDHAMSEVLRIVYDNLPACLKKGEVLVLLSSVVASNATRRGVHLVWQHVLVTKRQAKHLRDALVANITQHQHSKKTKDILKEAITDIDMSKNHPTTPVMREKTSESTSESMIEITSEITSETMRERQTLIETISWESAVDASVFNTGLRMAFSCKGLPKDRCRVYVPDSMISFDVEGDVATYSVAPCRSFFHSSTDTKINVNAQIKELILFVERSSIIHCDDGGKNPARCIVEEELPPLVRHGRRRGHQDHEDHQGGEDNNEEDDHDHGEPGSRTALTAAQERRVRKDLPDVYKTANFTAVYMHDDHAIVCLDSRFCNNLSRGEREHRSNRVYLALDAYGIRQKCFCKCNTTEGRASGQPCKTFAHMLSPKNPLAFKKKEMKLEMIPDDDDEMVSKIAKISKVSKVSKNSKDAKDSKDSKTNNMTSKRTSSTGKKGTSTSASTSRSRSRSVLNRTTRGITTPQEAILYWCERMSGNAMPAAESNESNESHESK